MVKINWTETAISDLSDIGEYISKDSFSYSSYTVEELFVSTDILIRNPKAGRKLMKFNNL